jgi:AcrR family transcriptional regulator
MPDPTPADLVEQIRELAAEGLGRNEVARRLDVSPRTVTRYAPAGAFDRSATMAAVKARQADMAERRARLADALLSDAERMREQIWQTATVFNFGGKDNDYNDHTFDEQPPDGKRTLMQAVSTAVAAHVRLIDHDGDGTTEQAKSVLDGFMEAVAERAAELGAAGGT